MIEARNIIHRYDGKEVLSLPTWKLERGQRALLIGASGSGKTTLLHCLAGLLKPTEGDILLADKPFSKLPAAQRDEIRGQKIGIIFQTLHLVSALNVLENLKLAQYLAGKKQDEKAALSLLESLDILALAKARSTDISQGQAQRVAIARALINKPEIILADEPTSALDDQNAKTIIDLLIHTANEAQATLVVSTHDQRIKDRFANSVQLGGNI